MFHSTRSHARALQLLLISLAIHACIIGALWAIIHTHPITSSELTSSGWSTLPIEVEGNLGKPSPPTAKKENSPNGDHSAPQASTASAPNSIDQATQATKPLIDNPALTGSSTSTSTSNGKATVRGDNAVAIGQGDPYFSQVRSKIQSQVHYTPAMARRRLQGQVQIALTLLANGSIASLNIQKSSGSPELDQQALDSVRAATPFPAFSFTAPARKLELPIDFRLQ